MKRFLHRKFYIGTAKLSVTRHVPWHWRLLTAVVALGVLGALGAWVFDVGTRFSWTLREQYEAEVKLLRAKVVELESEVHELRSVSNASESRVRIERSAQEQLAQHLKNMEQENLRLKEDLAFFENLMPGEGKEEGVNISRFKVEADGAPGRYRYRLLAVQQSVRRDREFRGMLQLVVKLQQDGKDGMMVFPGENAPERSNYVLGFRYFQRMEGVITLPPRAVVQVVEARLVQDGVVRASQTARL